MQNSRSHWSHKEPRKISKWPLRMMIVLHVLCLLPLPVSYIHLTLPTKA